MGGQPAAPNNAARRQQAVALPTHRATPLPLPPEGAFVYSYMGLRKSQSAGKAAEAQSAGGRSQWPTDGPASSLGEKDGANESAAAPMVEAVVRRLPLPGQIVMAGGRPSAAAVGSSVAAGDPESVTADALTENEASQQEDSALLVARTSSNGSGLSSRGSGYGDSAHQR